LKILCSKNRISTGKKLQIRFNKVLSTFQQQIVESLDGEAAKNSASHFLLFAF